MIQMQTQQMILSTMKLEIKFNQLNSLSFVPTTDCGLPSSAV